MLLLSETRPSPLSHDPSFPFLLSLPSPCPYSLAAAVSALSVLCLFLLSCLGVSAVAVTLSSSVGGSKFFHRLFPFYFLSLCFCFLSVSLFVLLVLFLMSYPSLWYKSRVKFVLSVGSVNVISLTVFKVMWLVVVTCRGIPVK